MLHDHTFILYIRALCVKTFVKMLDKFLMYYVDVKETARIQGNIDKNVFLRYYEKLWNTTNINESQLEYNSTDYLHAFITLDELEKVLKLTKKKW